MFLDNALQPHYHVLMEKSYLLLWTTKPNGLIIGYIIRLRILYVTFTCLTLAYCQAGWSYDLNFLPAFFVDNRFGVNWQWAVKATKKGG